MKKQKRSGFFFVIHHGSCVDFSNLFSLLIVEEKWNREEKYWGRSKQLSMWSWFGSDGNEAQCPKSCDDERHETEMKSWSRERKERNGRRMATAPLGAGFRIGFNMLCNRKVKSTEASKPECSLWNLSSLADEERESFGIGIERRIGSWHSNQTEILTILQLIRFLSQLSIFQLSLTKIVVIGQKLKFLLKLSGFVLSMYFLRVCMRNG